MTDKEKLESRIRELEKENKRLSKLLETGNAEFHPVCPYSHETLSELSMGKTEISQFSRAIRQYVFKETGHTQKKVGLYYIHPRNMTDDQYRLYVKTMDGMIQALRNGREEAVKSGLNGWKDDVHL